MSDMSWLALALALTVCGGLWTWYAARNRGGAAVARGVGITLLPGAAYLTGTLEMFGEVGASVADWATGFVFSPLVWLGIVMFGISVLLFGVSGRMGGGSSEASPTPKKNKKDKKQRDQLPRSSQEGTPVIDDDLADIEALLKKRGIE